MIEFYQGDYDTKALIDKYKVLDQTGFNNVRNKLSWDLGFRLERNYDEVIRKLYFTIFEISSIVRELNFRNIDPTYALPPIVKDLNTSLPLKWDKKEVRLQRPLSLSVKIDDILRKYGINTTENVSENSLIIDLYRETGVMGLEVEVNMSIKENLNANVDIVYKPIERGLKRGISAEELNRVLRVTAGETNQKSISIHSQLNNVEREIIGSIIDPILERFAKSMEYTDFVYIPPCRNILYSLSTSALTDEEKVQIFSEGCIIALERLRKVLKDKNGVEVHGKEIVLSEDLPLNVKSLAVIKLLVLSAKGNNPLILIEYPEEFLKKEDKEELLKFLKNVNGRIVIVSNDDYLINGHL